MAEEIKEIIPEVGDPLPSNWIEKAEAELKSNKRILKVKNFRDQEECEIHIFRPTVDEDSQAAYVYSKVFNKYLSDPDFKTNSEMEKVLEDRGIYGQPQKDRLDRIRDDMNAVAIEICSIRDDDDYKEKVVSLRKQWVDLRNEAQEISILRQSFMGNTVESKAEEERNQVRLSLCVKFADGTRVWPDISDLKNEKDMGNLSFIITEAMTFWAGLNTEIIHALPDEIIDSLGSKVNQTSSKTD